MGKRHCDSWYVAHEHLLMAVIELLHICCFRTKRKYVVSSRGRCRVDVEVRGMAIADKPHTVFDVAES